MCGLNVKNYYLRGVKKVGKGLLSGCCVVAVLLLCC